MRSLMICGLCVGTGLFAQAPKPAPPGGSYIGVMMQEINADRAKALNLREEGGVEVTVVEPDSPAEKAGLKAGDVVLKYGSLTVEDMEQFARLVRETPPGREIKLEISRAGNIQTVMVRIGLRKTPHLDWNDSMQPNERMEIRVPAMPHSFVMLRGSILGMEAESLDGQLAQYFGVKDGVLVRSVQKGTSADKAGLRAGDVITKIDDQHIATPADIAVRLRSMRGKSVSVGIVRDHKELTLSLTVSEDDPGRILITPFQVTPPPQQ